ncbi:hypothetical protein M422DRAFT_785492 [Sphaerobolus stellatus SS14]|uniref:NADH dehydrogenase [ubiquinone] iron-sulfur protein 5 n=1 Tax=Sphaerobolus stellatus (strain SS14) TaxID=990650 RepID=A0A0C9UK34_SPHS4|nr:hypothetical protein M422DRAFT_785492 [Sphaerobolus stellatus SS14]
MASGFGYHGGRSRCYNYWQEFMKCYTQTDDPGACRPPAEDYMECLHHTKEIERAKIVHHQFLKLAEQQAHEGQKAGELLGDGVIVGVGLIAKDRGESGGSKH